MYQRVLTSLCLETGSLHPTETNFLKEQLSISSLSTKPGEIFPTIYRAHTYSNQAFLYNPEA